jgi:predicted phage replisome organizer
MSDNKKYYYIKIKENFYDTDDIRLLQSMDNGYLYSDILMKLYLKSLKHNGKLMFKDHIPFNAKMIATITGHNIAIVEKALGIFVDIGLIEILDNGAIYMLDIQNFIGQSSTEADRKKEYRKRIAMEKNKLLPTGEDICPDIRPQSEDKIPPEIEIDIEKDIEIRDRDKNKPSKHKYGEYKHVLLTDEEHTKLINEYGDIFTEKCIKHLDEYMEMIGKKYKSCYLAIRKWVVEAVNKKEGNSYGNGVRGDKQCNDKNQYNVKTGFGGLTDEERARAKAEGLL